MDRERGAATRPHHPTAPPDALEGDMANAKSKADKNIEPVIETEETGDAVKPSPHERRVNAAQKRAERFDAKVEKARARKAKAEEVVAKADEVIAAAEREARKAHDRVEWLQNDPAARVDDDESDAEESDTDEFDFDDQDGADQALIARDDAEQGR